MTFGSKQKAATLVLALGTEKAGALLQTSRKKRSRRWPTRSPSSRRSTRGKRWRLSRNAGERRARRVAGRRSRPRPRDPRQLPRQCRQHPHRGWQNRTIFLSPPTRSRIDRSAARGRSPADHRACLSDLDSDIASTAVLGLPEELRTEVSFRLANIGTVSPAVLETVVASLQERLSGAAATGAAPPTGRSLWLRS